MKRLRILLSNDDGYLARGINELALALTELGDVTIVAPDVPHSGFSGAISTTKPIRLKPRPISTEGITRYSSDGTPADCVKLALNTLFREEAPDLIISGINHGRNDGICVHYSGTIAAAREGAIVGLPALALSLDVEGDEHADFAEAIQLSLQLVRQMEHITLPKGTLLSLNVPAGKVKGLRICPQTIGRFVDEFMASQTPTGRPVYWMQGYQQATDNNPNADLPLLEDGFATLTPLMVDQTDHTFLGRLSELVQG